MAYIYMPGGSVSKRYLFQGLGLWNGSILIVKFDERSGKSVISAGKKTQKD